ncbi:glycosyltransferase family 4 protein [Paraburkholderia tropica]|uniref:Glycosyltransferase involved in cell wall biosynthesis n=1 Tax=Paraburkholderia tropica TaxID=92647 RepID=A0ABX5MSJ6_9BURK|nr:glycosyltransferase family 4 protein [Paraburkholderia tropica]MDE1141685.1 glycosyltransferase family 4 protein [Paraburkholderia tropica]PXX16404.1 glycosyltransferase involved in cell wall biosynthesis [Paraburkholderia tropica]PZW82796.1 glycosyltransferase involved in cell wall biosynthesis [Paraburkholderia tropica]
MKVGISSNALKHSGGLERYAMDLVRGLAARGMRPAFFARKFDVSVPECALVERHRINVSLLPGKLRDAWFSWRLAALRRRARVDVLIGCNRVDSSEIAICGGTHRGFLRATGRPLRASDRRQIALESRQYAQSRVVVAHSELMRDELRELYGVDDSKIRVLCPPVDGERFSPVDAATRAALRKQYGFADNETVLLFPSSSHTRKGLPLIQSVVEALDLPVVVAVAGRPPERTSTRVRYIGYVKDLENAYRAADYSILASTYEPFGLVGIESVMCGTPVIFSTNIGCADAIAGSAKQLFAPGDAAGLRRIIESAVAARAPRLDATPSDAILYDASVPAHVDALLALATDIVSPR